jgi:N-acetyl-anhydromuramyl-L-alanine amidase AmpD
MIEASDPFLGVNRLSRDGFVSALQARTHNPGLEAERDLGEYWQECIAYGVDSAFALSMFIHESSCGTAGSSLETFSWGNTRNPSFGSVPYDLVAGRSGEFPAFASWLEGLRSTVARLSSMVWPVGAPYGERTSILEVFEHPSGAVWAPSSDLNDPNSYLSSMLSSMNQYADCEEWIVQTALVVPPVYQDYLSINYTPGRAGHSVEAIVLHVTQSENASGTIGWFKNPASKVSSHYILDRDGVITALVREHDQAWVNGVVEHPNRDIPIVDEWVTTDTNPNRQTIGIECAGYSPAQPHPTDPSFNGYTEEQFQALAYLLPVLSARHGVAIAPDTTFGHKEISGTQRKDCPGLSDEEWTRVYSTSTPVPDGPYDTPDAAYDAYCAQWDDDVVWAGEIRDKGHWYQRNPQEVSRTVGHRLLAYDGAYAQNASGWMMDEWEEAAWRSGQLTIWGKEPPPAGTPPPTAPVDPVVGIVGAAWPVDPVDGETDVATTVTLEWGVDAPTTDLEFDQSDGVRIFALQAHTSTAYGPLTLAEATTYVWRVRGRDSGNVSDWTEARFGTTTQTPVGGGGTDEEKPDKPPSTEPYPPVVTPTGAEAPAAVTWRNTSDNKVDLAVSRQWRSDSDGGTGPWPDTDAWLNPDFPGAETAQSPLELRKLTRRLSMHPPIVEAAWRAGLWASVPATYQVKGSQWEDDASQDYNDTWSSVPAHAQTWASQICTLGTAIQQHPDLAAAFVSLGIWSAYATTWTERYHALRVRVRDLAELAHC